MTTGSGGAARYDRPDFRSHGARHGREGRGASQLPPARDVSHPHNEISPPSHGRIPPFHSYYPSYLPRISLQSTLPSHPPIFQLVISTCNKLTIWTNHCNLYDYISKFLVWWNFYTSPSPIKSIFILFSPNLIWRNSQGLVSPSNCCRTRHEYGIEFRRIDEILRRGNKLNDATIPLLFDCRDDDEGSVDVYTRRRVACSAFETISPRLTPRERESDLSLSPFSITVLSGVGAIGIVHRHSLRLRPRLSNARKEGGEGGRWGGGLKFKRSPS